MLLILLIAILFAQPVFANTYGVYNYDDYSVNNFDSSENERILFILDFSNSMNEFLNGRRKVDLMLETMKMILPSIDSNIHTGLRVYGHKTGFTAMDACRASDNISPVSVANSFNIRNSLSKLKPRGMTPITYSLKQAIKYDFMGFSGTKRIILLTDGGENCDESPCKFVMELVKTRRDIKIDVIAFNIKNSDDLSQLQCTSLVTSGRFYNAQTAAELLKSMDSSINSFKNVEAKIIKNP